MKIRRIYNDYQRLLLYVFILIFFIFRDFENLSSIYKIKSKINNMKQKEFYYKEEIEKLKIQYSNFENQLLFEKYVREKFYLKKENEDIIILEYKDIKDKQ